jgi:hypothetical protein
MDLPIPVIESSGTTKTVRFFRSLRGKGIRRASHAGVPQSVARRIASPKPTLRRSIHVDPDLSRDA